MSPLLPTATVEAGIWEQVSPRLASSVMVTVRCEPAVHGSYTTACISGEETYFCVKRVLISQTELALSPLRCLAKIKQILHRVKNMCTEESVQVGGDAFCSLARHSPSFLGRDCEAEGRLLVSHTKCCVNKSAWT